MNSTNSKSFKITQHQKNEKKLFFPSMAASLPSNDFLKKKSIWNREEGILQFLSLPVAGARDKGGFCGAAQFFNISAISYTG